MLEENGIAMEMNETPVTALQVVQAHMVRETGAYMRDYVWDSEGRLVEIKFQDIE